MEALVAEEKIRVKANTKSNKIGRLLRDLTRPLNLPC